MSEQLKASTIRSIYGGVILTAVQFFPLLSQTSDWKILVASGGSTFFGYLLLRGMAEGLIDSNRAPTSADVGQPKP